MSIDRLGGQLVRELARNKKKSAVLGLLGLVALWFWAPLVMKWVKPSPSVSKAAKPAASAAVDTVTSTTPAKAKTKKKAEVPWTQLAKAIEHDPRMRPAVISPDQRNPFLAMKEKEDEVKETATEVAAEAPPPEPEVTPASLGLQLSSTSIGPAGRLARIDGVLYRQGTLVRPKATPVETVQLGGVYDSHMTTGDVEPATSPEEVAFRLVEVYPQAVVLERKGKRYLLKIELKPATNSDHMVVADPAFRDN